MIKVENYINGNVTSDSNIYLPICDPSKGEKIGDVVNSNNNDFNNLIESSLNAFNLWSKFLRLKCKYQG